jgi:hypothetical protein
MALCSLAQYAKLHGASKQAASKWKTRGVLVFSGGQVDVEKSDKAMRGAGLGNFKPQSTEPLTIAQLVDPKRKSVDGRSRKVDQRKPAVDPASKLAEAEGEDINHEEVDDFLSDIDRGLFTTQVNADRIKANALAARQLLSLRRDAGELIEIERAGQIFFDLTRAERDSWITWPVRIGPLLAADLGLETATVVEALTNYVQEQLETLGQPEPDFTKE